MARGVSLVVLLVALVLPAGARADQRYYYLRPQEVDLTMLLPPPPNVASAQERADEQAVAAAVAARSPAQLYDAEANSMRSVFYFSGSVGPGFNATRLPVTARLFSHVRSDVEQLIDEAKTYWNRARPSGAQKARGSYPSGHAAFAAAAAIVLSQLIPSKRAAIFAKARVFAENRILLGLHFPSDVASGWTAGTLAAYVMMHDRAFQQDFIAARVELQRANF